MDADVEAGDGHRSARARGLTAVREEARTASDPLTGPPPVSLDAAADLAAADCREPGHACRSGRGCAEFLRFVEDARSALARYGDAVDRYTAVLSAVDPDADAFHRESDGGLLLRAVLAPQEWERAARGERAALEPRLREYLPPDPDPDAPPPVRAAHGLLVHRLAAALRGLDARIRRLTGERDDLRRFARVTRRARSLPLAAELLGPAAGLTVFRFSYGDGVLFALVTSVVVWLLSAWILRMVLTRVAARQSAGAQPDSCPAGDGALDRAERAARDAARLDEWISDLEAVYERLR